MTAKGTLETNTRRHSERNFFGTQDLDVFPFGVGDKIYQDQLNYTSSPSPKARSIDPGLVLSCI